MISQLAYPTVCVIDDDKDEYVPILQALNDLNVGCVHIKGDEGANLPATHLSGLRLVFTDLHLNSSPAGKPSASHTANVFCKIVSANTAPVVVVIWSKFADAKTDDPDLPPDDQPTEAELFISTLLEAENKFKGRLIFLQMPKPKPGDRPAKWVSKLKTQIKKTLQGHDAVDALLTWESIVKEAINRVSVELTSLAQSPVIEPDAVNDANPDVPKNLKLIMQLLAQEQGGPDCSPASASRHIVSVLAQTLADQLEHSDSLNSLSKHGRWLSDRKGVPKKTSMAPGINGLLLTASTSKKPNPFTPGTIYRLSDINKFKALFGVEIEELLKRCCKYKDSPTKYEAWKAANKPHPVLVELSPACDVQQETRRNSLLIGGLVFPANARKDMQRTDSIEVLPTFSVRWATEDFAQQDAFLVFFSHFKLTHSASKEPKWLLPWFRLRELPTASLRNWHSAHASRVGYVSLVAAV